MKKITNDLLYKYSFLSGLHSNKVGDRTIFVRSMANKDDNKYDSNLYIYQNKKIEKLTTCNSASEFFWLDDNNVVFSSKRADFQKKTEKNHDTESQKEDTVSLYKKNTEASTEAEFFVELKGNISNIKKLANNRLIYLKNRDITSEDDEYFADQKNEDGFMRAKRIPFYEDGSTFNFNKKNALCIVDIASGVEEEIDSQNYSIESFEVSKDKSKILMIASKIQKKYSVYTALFEYDVQSKKLSKLVDDKTADNNEVYLIYLATYLDNKPFFLGTTMKKHGLNENVKAYQIEDGKVKLLNNEDRDYLNLGVQDMEFKAGKEYQVFDEHIDFITSNGTTNKIARLGVDGKFQDVFEFDGGISCFDYVDDKKIFVGLNTQGGQEIYLEDKKISKFHNFLSEYYVAQPQPISVNSTGYQIDGFVLLPEDYDKKASHPAVLEIHGGPKAAYQKTYFHEMQMLVNEGYVVMFCNPRGSAAKGDLFSDIFGLYGDVDYKNIMDFTNTVLEKYNKIDKDRLFVTGGSYGGYMTNHIIGQTNIFKAAVTQRSIANWMSFYGTSDIGYYFATDQHRTKIEDKDFWQKLWEFSPIKNVDNVKTPTLIIHSDCDFRCPVEQAYQLFTALVDRGIDSEMLVFKEESHGLSRMGKPNNRYKRLEAIRDWFYKHT